MKPADALRGRRILIIEDDPTQRETLRRLVEARGAHVVVAADGLEGLALLERAHPDAVLCDLAMPIMDGIEFATRMRREPRYRRVPLIAVTGRVRQSDVIESWGVGFDGHLLKPFRPEDLDAILHRFTPPPA
jgi:CheY-like chemotaxis protein